MILFLFPDLQSLVSGMTHLTSLRGILVTHGDGGTVDMTVLVVAFFLLKKNILIKSHEIFQLLNYLTCDLTNAGKYTFKMQLQCSKLQWLCHRLMGW